jgi:hypothetical protein
VTLKWQILNHAFAGSFFGQVLTFPGQPRANASGQLLTELASTQRETHCQDATMTCIRETYPPFTLDQLTTLSAWGSASPLGLGVRIATDHQHYPEVAMLFRRDAHQVRYMMYPISSGTGIMVRSPILRWTMPDVETALAGVLALEQRNAGA